MSRVTLGIMHGLKHVMNMTCWTGRLHNITNSKRSKRFFSILQPALQKQIKSKVIMARYSKYVYMAKNK